MPLTLPVIDDRTYQQLLDEALARVPVHNPEWTNFNRSDPGVTLIEVFAFLTESLLYRSKQIPERNRYKFLQLLGVPLQAAASARGQVTFSNERGPLRTVTLNADLEVRAGPVPFRTTGGLDVLPIEAQIFYKRSLPITDDRLVAYYRQLYASFIGQGNLGDKTPQIYETTPFPPRGNTGVDLGSDAIDASLWIALLARPNESVDDAREEIGGKTLSLGIVPVLADANRQLVPGDHAGTASEVLLQYRIPKIPASGGLLSTSAVRTPEYRALEARPSADVLAEPGIVEITLPPAGELRLWDDLDPLESGVGDLPPALEDTNLNERVITWLRISSSAAVRAPLLWAGINTVFVTQRARVANERLPEGTGEPDQVAVLSRNPIVPGSLSLRVTSNGTSEVWTPIADLSSAGPEVPVVDPRLPPGTISRPNPLVKVFMVDHESGTLRFGDGMRGARPPYGAQLQVDYSYGVGPSGNVGAGAINTGPALPAGFKVSNPLRTWGGTASETVAEGEKQVARYLQHRDRLVNTADFETITLRTPGVDIGRVEVLPAFNPVLSPNEPGDAPGAVTLMIIPRYDPQQPDAPRPDRLFLNTICAYLDARRLITTEVFLRGPTYKGIWVSVGIDVVAGMNVAPVREAVKQQLLRFLSPLPDPGLDLLETQNALLSAPQAGGTRRGWPLRKPVNELELLAVASRVEGIRLVSKVLVAEGDKGPESQILMTGLELPRIAGISVVVGEPLELNELRGRPSIERPADTTRVLLPVPAIPEECR